MQRGCRLAWLVASTTRGSSLVHSRLAAGLRHCKRDAEVLLHRVVPSCSPLPIRNKLAWFRWRTRCCHHGLKSLHGCRVAVCCYFERKKKQHVWKCFDVCIIYNTKLQQGSNSGISNWLIYWRNTSLTAMRTGEFVFFKQAFRMFTLFFFFFLIFSIYVSDPTPEHLCRKQANQMMVKVATKESRTVNSSVTLFRVSLKSDSCDLCNRKSVSTT